jgi:sulfatase maturation enzyme AslB (radical SAM superfamily)
MLKLNQITALHIELTTNCNARCPMCPRNYRGYDYNSGYPVTELSIANIKKIFSTNFLKQIKYVNFNGNLGDFGMAKDALQIVEYFLDNSNCRIQIETNGSMRLPSWWAQLVNSRIRILWALDGLEDTHSLYRQDTDWHNIIKNATAYISAGGYAAWKFIPFDHNKHQVDQCRQLSRDMGFKEFLVWNSGRNQGPVFSKKGEFSHWLGTQNSQIPEILPMIQHYETWFDPKKSIPWIKNESAKIDCRHIKQKELYLAADGSVYPCCWLGFYPSTMSYPGNNQISALIKNNNALDHSLEECLTWFDEVERSWDKPTIAEGKLFRCLTSCGIKTADQ